MHVYVEHVRDKAIRFEVLSFDADTNMGKLRGGLGTELMRDISRPMLEKYNYKLVRSDKELPLIGEVPQEDPDA